MVGNYSIDLESDPNLQTSQSRYVFKENGDIQIPGSRYKADSKSFVLYLVSRYDLISKKN